jgi:uncharacterized cupin superfamily protein
VTEGVSRVTLDLDAGERFQTLRRELGAGSFGINLLRLEPGQRGRIHRHERQEEVYVVLEGELTLIVDGEELTLARNEVVRIAPEPRRQLVHRGAAPLRILALGGYGEHRSRDGIAWASWDEPDDAGRPPQEVPLPEDLSLD